MSIRAVVGAGPRTGTSFVMRKLQEAGVPIHYHAWMDDQLPAEGNPDGYFETNREYLSFSHLSDVVVKVWPGDHKSPDIERMVILKRNRDEQIASVEKQFEREGIEDWTPGELVDTSYALISDVDVPHRVFSTDNLDNDIDEIIEYMRY